MSKMATLCACVLTGVLLVPLLVEFIAINLGLLMLQPLFFLFVFVMVSAGGFVCGVAFKVVKDE